MPGICMSRMARSKRSPARSQSKACSAVMRGARNHAPFAGLRGQNAAVGRIIVHDQDAQIGQLRLPSVERGAVRFPARPGSGRVKWNVEPFSGTLSTHILPPINSTSRLLMASPRPVPPKRRVVEASAWLKDLNRRARRSTGMPMPVSRTEKCRCQGSLVRPFRRGRRQALLPARPLRRGGEFDAVAEQIHQHLPQSRHITDAPVPECRPPSGRRYRVSFRRLWRRADRAHSSMHARKSKRLLFQIRACRIRSSKNPECR